MPEGRRTGHKTQGGYTSGEKRSRTSEVRLWTDTCEVLSSAETSRIESAPVLIASQAIAFKALVVALSRFLSRRSISRAV